MDLSAVDLPDYAELSQQVIGTYPSNMTHEELIKWIFKNAIYPALVNGAVALPVLPAVHADAPPPAFARTTAVPVFAAPAHADGESPHEPEPEQTMPGPESTTVITGARAPANPARGYWRYKSLTELEWVQPRRELPAPAHDRAEHVARVLPLVPVTGADGHNDDDRHQRQDDEGDHEQVLAGHRVAKSAADLRQGTRAELGAETSRLACAGAVN